MHDHSVAAAADNAPCQGLFSRRRPRGSIRIHTRPGSKLLGPGGHLLVAAEGRSLFLGLLTRRRRVVDVQRQAVGGQVLLGPGDRQRHDLVEADGVGLAPGEQEESHHRQHHHCRRRDGPEGDGGRAPGGRVRRSVGRDPGSLVLDVGRREECHQESGVEEQE